MADAAADYEKGSPFDRDTNNDSDGPGALTKEDKSDTSGNAPAEHTPWKEQPWDNTRPDGKREVLMEYNWEKTAFAYPTWKKWTILTVIFVVQCSMNFNAGVYGNAVVPLSEHFNISEQHARSGQAVFLIAYAFGCELWAPWSEEFGRWPILQLSLFLVNIWQIPCAVAQNYNVIVAFRFMGGISSAGGSVTLGMIADMWEPAYQQYAVAYVVLSSVGGSIIGPIVGGFVQEHMNWRWVFWLQLCFGGATQIIHFFFVPETRTTILLDREAKRRRKAGQTEWYGPNELREQRITFKEVITLWTRPFYMFVTEPIVLCLSLLSGFSDALIFTFLESYGPVFSQWNFSTEEQGLAFVAIGIGYFIAYISFLPPIHYDIKMRAKDPDRRPESRLWWLLFTAPLEAIGLFWFAWTSSGPPIPWIVPLIATSLIGIANYAIYMATVDYMIAAYGPYSASATGGNGMARDFLAGIAAFYATPMYMNIHPPQNLQWASTVLGCLAVVVAIPIYVFYFYGEWFRERSKFAQTIEADRKGSVARRDSFHSVVGANAGSAQGNAV